MNFRFSGFRDGHCHPLFAERESAGPNLDECETVEAIVAAITQYLRDNPACVWVDAGAVDRAVFASHGNPARVLDLASPEIPVVVHANDHHAIWVNSPALRAANLESQAPLIANAHIDVDELGKPTGMLHEWDAMKLIYEHQPKTALEDDLAALARATEKLLSYGVVAVQEAWIDPGMPEVYLAAAERDLLRLRVDLAPRIAPQSWREDLDFAIETRARVAKAANPLLTCGRVKVFIDGVLGSKTALLKQPYLDDEGVEATTNTGQQIWQQSDLEDFANAADNLGFQLHFHAIGDAAVDQVLDALQRLPRAKPDFERRPVIAHAELIDPTDFERLRLLGVVVCQQPIWAQPDQAQLFAQQVLGEDRANLMYPIGSLLRAGVRVSFGSDWPVSEPNPLLSMYGAITRSQPTSNGSLNLGEAITNSQALVAHSNSVAFQLGQEDQENQDWVEMDTNLETCTPRELLAAKVIRVCVAGRVVFPG